MKKIRRRTLWWLTAALVTGIGANCNEVQAPHTDPNNNPFPAPADTRPTCPEVEFRSPDERCLTIQTFMPSSFGPYDVYIKITGGTGAYPPHVPIAAGGWKHSLVYRTGVKMALTVTLSTDKVPPKGEGFCSITDGSQHAKDDVKSIRVKGGSPYAAICNLTTNQ